MLLTAGGDNGRFRLLCQDADHAVLVTFTQWQPLAIENEVTVIPHSLWLVFINQSRQFFALLIKAEQAGIADNITVKQLVTISEGGPYPFLEQLTFTDATTNTAGTLSVCVFWLAG